jgi:hypothetical protein
MFNRLRERGFEIEFRSHAEAILGVDFPEVAEQLEGVLLASTIPIEEIIGSGGGETKGTQRLRNALAAYHWRKSVPTSIDRSAFHHCHVWREPNRGAKASRRKQRLARSGIPGLGFARAGKILLHDQRDSTSPVLFEKIFPFPPHPNQLHIPAVPSPTGAYRDRHGRGAGCGGRGSVGRAT